MRSDSRQAPRRTRVSLSRSAEGVPMKKRLVLYSIAVAMTTAIAVRLGAQSPPPARQLVERAAAALGGRDRLMALKTLQIVGYGELAYMNGGGNISADPAAPQKWQKVLDYRRAIDLE